MGELTIRVETLVLIGFGSLLGLLGLNTYGITVPLLRPIVVFCLLTFVPGGLLLLLLDIRPQRRAQWLTYSVGLSLMLVMLTGFVVNFGLLAIGYERPLSLAPLTVAFTILIAALLLGVRISGTPRVAVRIPEIDEFPIPPLALLLLPLLVIVSVWVLNTTRNTVPIVLLLGVIAIVPVAVAVGTLSERWFPLCVWACAVAVLYHKGFWRLHDYVGQASVVNFWRIGQWNPAQNGLLEHGTLFPIYARLSGISILTQMEVVNPVLISGFVPVAMYILFRRFTEPKQAFLGAMLFVFAHPFYLQYPTGGRVATPVLFLVLLAVTITDPDLPRVVKKGFSFLFAFGIVTTHYGTSYIVMFALVGALFLLVAEYILNYSVASSHQDGSVGRLFSVIPVSAVNTNTDKPRDPQIRYLSIGFVLYYVFSALAWYLFTFQSKQFAVLVAFAERVVNTVLYLDPGRGSTLTRLQSNYGSPSIALSKRLYVIIAILMALGFLVAYYRQFFGEKENQYDEEFLAFAAMLFAVFAGTVVVPGAWGGGRPMMIVFSLSAIFAVVGVTAGIGRLKWMLVRFAGLFGDGMRSRVNRGLGSPAHIAVVVFAIFLTMFFAINSGLAAATVLGGEAPSTVPIQEAQKDTFRNTNLQTHVWLVDYRATDERIFGDRQVWAQVDWYAPSIAAKKEDPNSPHYQIKPGRDNLQSLQAAGTEPGYVLLHGENYVNGRQKVSHLEWKPIDELEPEFERRNRIYATGQSAILYSNQSATG